MDRDAIATMWARLLAIETRVWTLVKKAVLVYLVPGTCVRVCTVQGDKR